ncbi:MAG: purine-nucleoside phosphorylase [Ignavibacteriae bacterium]|nr:purine-nucleoside phosphorylase [Ignavibacteriota bacterium]
MDHEQELNESVAYILDHVQARPTIAVVLGSGLGDFADNLVDREIIATADIPNYPRSTIVGHKGKLVFASVGNKPIVAFQGRTHYYESNNLKSVLFPVHVAHRLGIKQLIVTNAAGGLNRNFVGGDLMIMTDQINLTFVRIPGFEFSDASLRPIYSHAMIEKAEQAAAENTITVRKGVYVGLKGPSYETAAEIGMLTRIGGDAVGMSTVFETSLASSLGMEVLGISCITNLATGISPTKLSHEEVTEVGNRVKHTFARLISATIALL